MKPSGYIVQPSGYISATLRGARGNIRALRAAQIALNCRCGCWSRTCLQTRVIVFHSCEMAPTKRTSFDTERKSCDPGQAQALETRHKSTQCSRATRHHRIRLFCTIQSAFRGWIGPRRFDHPAAYISHFGPGPGGGWYNRILLYLTITKSLTSAGVSSEGLSGLLTGLGKGLVGTVTKPAVGVLDLATGAASAVRDSSRSSAKEVPRRLRPPRLVTGPGAILPRYSERQGRGQQLLHQLNAHAYQVCRPHLPRIVLSLEHPMTMLHWLIAGDVHRLRSSGQPGRQSAHAHLQRTGCKKKWFRIFLRPEKKTNHLDSAAFRIE